MTDTIVTYAYQLPVQVAPHVGIDRFFDLTAAQNGVPVQQFSVPVSIAVRYSDENRGVAIEDSLRLCWQAGDDWVTDGITTALRSHGTLTSLVDHFTLFAVLGETNRAYLPVVSRTR